MENDQFWKLGISQIFFKLSLNYVLNKMQL